MASQDERVRGGLSGTVLKAVRVLNELSISGTQLTVREIAQRTELDRATAYRLLQTLVETGLVTRDVQTRRYRLGLRVLDYAISVLDALEVRHISLSHLIELQRELTLEPDEVERTIFVAVPDGLDVVMVETGWTRAAVPRGSKMRFPAFASAAGRCMLAYLPPDQLTAALDSVHFEQRTPHTLITRADVEARIAHIRQVGYDISDREVFADLRAIAVPVLGRSGTALGSIGVSVPATSTTVEWLIERFAPKLLVAAQRTSMALRHRD
jgi:IclR family transcriptional regulator, pca regulon regulatory protein